MCGYLGCLCGLITTLTYVVRVAPCADDALLKQVDLASAACWGAIAVMDVKLKHIYTEAAFQQNMVLYGVLIGALYHQSTTRGAKRA